MSEPITFLETLVTALSRAADFNKNDQTPPATVLWTDKERQWEPLLPSLRLQLPLLTLDDYDPATRSGPATYLRCMLAGTLPDKLPPATVPIIYLPGVSRQELRAVEECPKALQPLAELQYRGVFWSHKNGKDWTVAGFLQSPDGLNITVATDVATREAIPRALLKLAAEPVAHLRKEAPLHAPFFDALLNPDDVRRLLKWMNDPQGYPAQMAPEEWKSFCALCTSKYGFDPVADGSLTAAAKFGSRYGAWAAAWDRFAEAPDAYPNLPGLLRQARPQQLPLFGEPSAYWPQDNEGLEEALRVNLRALLDTPPFQVRQTIADLETQHGLRRNWVWARLGQAPLAVALKHLVTLAQATAQPLGGADVDAIAGAYTTWGWQADAAVLDALAAVDKADDVAAVKATILPLYRPWLHGAAQVLQQAVALHPAERYVVPPLPSFAPGTCVLFCDGLRFDLGQRLTSALALRGLTCQAAWRLAPFPPVTATAKPAVSPVAAMIAGQGKHDLVPVSSVNGANVNVTVLRGLLHEAGWQVLQGDAMGDPAGRAWTEFGAIDRYGHDHGWKIAHHALNELAGLAERIEVLLRHGWKEVCVVTDHGWLLLPHGLPKVDLPQHLTHLRKGRCAVLKDGAVTDQQTVPWHWDHDVRIAVASGIGCYEAGKEYEHGGVSPQECIVPVIRVLQPVTTVVAAVTIQSITWKGLRCTVKIGGAASGMTVDIRSKAGDPASSLVKPKAVGTDGVTSLPVADDARQGDGAVIVVVDGSGALQTQMATIVGG